MHKYFDFWSLAVIVITLILFLTALVLKGFSHEMSLEAGVFLVSVKLILMSYKNSVLAMRTDERLSQIQTWLRDQKS